MTPITEIKPLWHVFPADAGRATGTAEEAPLFGDIFRSAIETVRETDAAKVEAEYLLSVGQLDNPAELTLASAKAQIAVDLLVQLRNRAVDAYSEVMRINL